ncbi:MAG: hypothetical protein WA139_03150 [Candidatus Aenigmatarchaeota archaeon]
MVNSESVSGWTIINSTMVAVSLTLLVLVIGLIDRVPKISLYLMLPSFVMFLNAIFANNKILEKISDKKHAQKWDDFATACFDAGLTFLISAFAVLSYKVVDIVSAAIFLAFVWGVAIAFNVYNGMRGKYLLKRFSRNHIIVWFAIEFFFLLLILADYFGMAVL